MTDVSMNRPLAILLAMAMFVLVVDTSIMNVAADLTVSGVQSAIPLEALVSAAGSFGLWLVFRQRRPAMPYKGTWIRHVCATIWAP